MAATGLGTGGTFCYPGNAKVASRNTVNSAVVTALLRLIVVPAGELCSAATVPVSAQRRVASRHNLHRPRLDDRVCRAGEQLGLDVLPTIVES